MATPSTIDVSQVIDRETLSWFQIRIIVLCALVAMLDGFDTQSIAFVASLIAPQLGMKIADFGPIFGSGLVGLTIGALAIAPWADRFGRKPIILMSTLGFGLFALLTVRSDSFASLFVYRLLTGLGLGAAMPNIIALTSEYAPSRSRAMLVTTMFIGFPFGAVIGGMISSMMIPLWGWQSVFYFGGLLPIVLTVILVFSLPESIRFMVMHGADAMRIGGTLRRIAPQLAYGAADRFVIAEAEAKGFPVRRLFTDGRGFGTVLLWVAFFMNLLLLFFMYNWLPPVLAQAGLPITRAVIGTVLFNLGGVIGGLVQGHVIDRVGHYIVLTAAYACGALFVALTGYLTFSFPLVMTAVVLAGFCTIGAQLAANSLAANFYPTPIRATGVGWALGIGRIGSILGPVIGGVLIGLNFDLHRIFLTAAIPAICATAAIALMSRVAPLSRKP